MRGSLSRFRELPLQVGPEIARAALLFALAHSRSWSQDIAPAHPNQGQTGSEHDWVTKQLMLYNRCLAAPLKERAKITAAVTA
jgi:hypothetical protein